MRALHSSAQRRGSIGPGADAAQTLHTACSHVLLVPSAQVPGNLGLLRQFQDQKLESGSSMVVGPSHWPQPALHADLAAVHALCH